MLRALSTAWPGWAASPELCSDLSGACVNEDNSDLCCWPKASSGCKKCSSSWKDYLSCIILAVKLTLACTARALSPVTLLGTCSWCYNTGYKTAGGESCFPPPWVTGNPCLLLIQKCNMMITKMQHGLKPWGFFPINEQKASECLAGWMSRSQSPAPCSHTAEAWRCSLTWWWKCCKKPMCLHATRS